MNDPAKATAANQQAGQQQGEQYAAAQRLQAMQSLSDFLRGQGQWGGLFDNTGGGGGLTGGSLASILGGLMRPSPPPGTTPGIPMQRTAANNLPGAAPGLAGALGPAAGNRNQFAAGGPRARMM